MRWLRAGSGPKWFDGSLGGKWFLEEMSGLGDILRFWKNYTDITETDKIFPCSRVDPLGFRFRVTKCFRADGHPWFQLKRGKKKRETFEIFRNDDDDDDDQDKHSSRADNNGPQREMAV